MYQIEKLSLERLLLMQKLSINIVSLDVPYPPDYGGVIDIFYKIKALYQLGVDIHLHCFEYGRGEKTELKKYCKQLHYYKRNTGLRSNLSTIPYITNSRRSHPLQRHLESNKYPIIFEGLHSVYPLLKGECKDRQVLFRSHNIEHEYYRYLANRASHVIRKAYYYKESFLLKKLLEKLPQNLLIGAISPMDTDYLKPKFRNTFWLPPFHSNDNIESLEGIGHYALYHGNLSVSENIEAAINLIAKFADTDLSLKIAGKEPIPEIIRLAEGKKNIELIKNPDSKTMEALIRQAQVILLPTSQSTGIKLKLLESLYKGRHCVANRAMVQNTRLEGLVIMEEGHFYEKTLSLMNVPFSKAEISKREAVLNTYYNNEVNAQLLIEQLVKPQPIF